MADCIFNDVKVSGMACAVPTKIKRTLDADELSKEELERFIESTGVREKRVPIEEQTTSDLCFIAAKELMAHKGYKPEYFDALIFVTQTADYMQPATAHVLHKRLSLPNTCIVFDINLGCSGYVFGMHTVASMIQGGGVS